MRYEAKCVCLRTQLNISLIFYVFQNVVGAVEVTSLDKLWNNFILNRKLSVYIFCTLLFGGGCRNMNGSIFYDY